MTSRSFLDVYARISLHPFLLLTPMINQAPLSLKAEIDELEGSAPGYSGRKKGKRLLCDLSERDRSSASVRIHQVEV